MNNGLTLPIFEISCHFAAGWGVVGAGMGTVVLGEDRGGCGYSWGCNITYTTSSISYSIIWNYTIQHWNEDLRYSYNHIWVRVSCDQGFKDLTGFSIGGSSHNLFIGYANPDIDSM